MFNLGFGEITVILVVALVFIGPKMLPELATNLGKAIREIRKATSDIRQEIELDEAIRRPLQELREAATLPPEELKRRDQLLAAERKAAEEEKQRIQGKDLSPGSLPTPLEPTIVDPTIVNASPIVAGSEGGNIAKFTGETIAREKPVSTPGSIFPPEVISAGGTMILHPPALEPELTPTIEFDTPSPVVATVRPLPPPPPPLPPNVHPSIEAPPKNSPSLRAPTPAIGSSTTSEVTQIDPPTSPVVEKPLEPKKSGPIAAAKSNKQPGSTASSPSSSRNSSRKKKA